MAKIYTYEVTGRMTFPLDMLRYDSAHPADPQSVDTLMAATRSHYADHASSPYKLRLRSHYLPTVDRWRSFGWNVVAGSSSEARI